MGIFALRNAPAPTVVVTFFGEKVFGPIRPDEPIDVIAFQGGNRLGHVYGLYFSVFKLNPSFILILIRPVN